MVVANLYLTMVYPVVILTPWIRQCIVENIEERGHYTSEVLVKDIISHAGPGSGDYTPIIRIQGIHRIFEEGKLIITIHDSKHKILGVITQDAIQKFESKYRQRITYETTHTLMIVQRAHLKFVSRKDASQFSRFLPTVNQKVSIAYLEINEVDFFSRLKHSVSMRSENELKHIYVTSDYMRLLGYRPSNTFFEASDGLISDCEVSDDAGES